MNFFLHPRYSIRRLRRNFERLSGISREGLAKQSPEARFVDEGEPGLPMESVSVGEVSSPVILYFHGGGYLMGSIYSYRRWALRLAFRCKAKIFVPQYRLAPEHPFPAAIEDAKRAFRLLLQRYPHTPIYFGGDSAGGGLALATLMSLRDEGGPLPRGAFLLSAYADLTAESESMTKNRWKDLWLSRKPIQRWAPLYYGGAGARHPLVSPVFGDFRGLPPLHVLVGGSEVLLSDSLTIAERAKAAGVKVALEVFERMQHGWPIAEPWLLESKTAVRSVAAFVSAGHS